MSGGTLNITGTTVSKDGIETLGDLIVSNTGTANLIGMMTGNGTGVDMDGNVTLRDVANFNVTGSRTFEFSGNSSNETGIEIGNLTVADDVVLNLTGDTDTGVGVAQNAGEHLTVSDNGTFNAVGTATGSGTGVKIGGSINTTGGGRVNIRGVSRTGTGVALQGAIRVSGGRLEIFGSSTGGAGVVQDPGSSLNTDDYGTTEIRGNSDTGTGVVLGGTTNTTGNGTTTITGFSNTGDDVLNGTTVEFNTLDNGTLKICTKQGCDTIKPK
jgi:hypothetical protein